MVLEPSDWRTLSVQFVCHVLEFDALVQKGGGEYGYERRDVLRQLLNVSCRAPSVSTTLS